MATGLEWQEYFKSVTKSKKKRLMKALDVLASDQMIYDEYKWSNLFTLGHLMRED